MHNARPLKVPVQPSSIGTFFTVNKPINEAGSPPEKIARLAAISRHQVLVRNNMGHVNAFLPALAGARHPGALDPRATLPVSLMDRATPALREEQA